MMFFVFQNTAASNALAVPTKFNPYEREMETTEARIKGESSE